MRTLSHYVRYRLGLAPAETQTTEAERAEVCRHAAGREVAVEVGAWHGVTTARLRAAVAPGGVVYAIDPYEAGRAGVSFPQSIAHREVRRVSNGCVEWVRATGEEAARRLAPELAGRVGLVFIDGDHSYDGLRVDWEGWSPLVAPGGVVALHDARPTPERPIHDAGSVRYTDAVIRRDPAFELVAEVDSLVVFRRRPQ